VTSSQYDGYKYVLGKGQSKTTVTAPLNTVAKGTSVLIQGTVMDMSPASPNTPAISDDSMDIWMDYLHLQMPIDGIWHNETVKGVPVTLIAFDSNGNPIDIGIAESDSSGSYQFAWTPPAEGVYKITATFIGSDSYGDSWAETGLSVGPAPTTTEPPTIPTPPDYTWTIVGMGIAVIIVVAIVGALILMRKR